MSVDYAKVKYDRQWLHRECAVIWQVITDYGPTGPWDMIGHKPRQKAERVLRVVVGRDRCSQTHSACSNDDEQWLTVPRQY